jgi:hypothetical protein
MKNFETELTIRDKFAIAALRGLISDTASRVTMQDTVWDAYRYADYMLVEREHDWLTRRDGYWADREKFYSPKENQADQGPFIRD